MNKQLILIFTFLVAPQNMLASTTRANIYNTRKTSYQFGALITACIALPLSALFFYRGMKAFDERKAIAESIPGSNLFIVPGSSHSTLIEHRDLFNQVVLEFFERK